MEALRTVMQLKMVGQLQTFWKINSRIHNSWQHLDSFGRIVGNLSQ